MQMEPNRCAVSALGSSENAMTVLFGPAGGGKSTLLRCLNRLNDLTEVKAASGQILIDGEDILDSQYGCDRLAPKSGHGLCTSCRSADEHP